MTSPPDYDVIIAGGGLVGTCLALGLAREDWRIALVEAVTPGTDQQPSFDDKGLALSLSSQRILAGLDLWQAVSAQACSVKHIHVSEKERLGRVHLHAADLHLPALGYVVPARELGRAFSGQLANTQNIYWLNPAVVENVEITPDRVTALIDRDGVPEKLTGRLLITADGTHSTIRNRLGIETSFKDYAQTAIVSNVAIGHDHGHTAFERFTTNGPLALLPMTENRYAVVYTVERSRADHCLQIPDAEFLRQLQQDFGMRPGRFLRVGRRRSYPLVMMRANEQVRERVVILGNAAHTIHPNGAQGFNLCLRDLAGLLDVLLPARRRGEDIGNVEMLRTYEEARKADQELVERGSDFMASVFYNDLPHRMLCRNSAMLLLDLCPPLKRMFIQRAAGIAGRQPSLVRNSPA